VDDSPDSCCSYTGWAGLRVFAHCLGAGHSRKPEAELVPEACLSPHYANIMTLFWIIIATLAGGVLSVLLAATFALSVLARFADKMVAFSVGVLLSFALTDILPEAVHLGLPVEQAGWTLLAGLIGFFLLEKLALWRHDHAASKGHNTDQPQVAMIVIGDGMHNFVDGVLIAAAFLTDTALGWATALAVKFRTSWCCSAPA